MIQMLQREQILVVIIFGWKTFRPQSLLHTNIVLNPPPLSTRRTAPSPRAFDLVRQADQWQSLGRDFSPTKLSVRHAVQLHRRPRATPP